jgi:nitric oxide dioxygenase
MINDQQKALVRTSWEKVTTMTATAAALFYARLFELDPSLRPLFTTDLKEQGEKLMKMLGLAVKGLEKPEALVPVLQDMARRHQGYGVEVRHYATVGAALLDTLEKGLGDAFDPPTRQAWTDVYALISGVMIDAVEHQPVSERQAS